MSGSRSHMRTLVVPGILSLFVAGGLIVLAQEKPAADQVEKLRAELDASRNRLSGLQNRAADRKRQLREASSQASLLDSIVSELGRREEQLAARLIENRERLDSLDDKVRQLRAEYVAAAGILYRKKLLTTPASILMLPHEYARLELGEAMFRQFVIRQERRADETVRLIDSLAALQERLQQQRDRQLATLAERQERADEIARLESRYGRELAETTSAVSSVQREIDERQSELRRLESMIREAARREEEAARRRSEERRRREEAAKRQDETSTATATTEAEAPEDTRDVAPPSIDGQFAASWPVNGRRVLQGYGRRTNRETNTVTVNPGINIAAARGSSVSAADRGRVSLVSWIKGYGTVVILQHADNWRTVYANLASASVSEGQMVAKGARVGTVGGGIDGEYLHFQVWQGQSRKNPRSILP